MYKTKGIKRIISDSSALVCMMSAMSFSPVAIESDAAELTAFEITEDMKIGWNYGNSLDATTGTSHAGLETETAWGNPKATQEMVDALKAKGFNTIRIPTTWFQHLDENNKIDAEWMARVHEVVDYAIKDDMYVILNVHHENWVNRADLGTAYDEMKEKLLAIWNQIADEFKDYDQHLVFECMNEPRAAGTDHEWWGPTKDEVDTINKLNADFVNLIRSKDSKYSEKRLLMIPGYCASSDLSMMQTVEVPDDPYVAVSVHAYSPYSFAMQVADSNGNLIDHSTYTEAYSSELHTILDNIRKTFVAKDIPVVIGEFSASNYNNTEARCEWATQFITETKQYGIPCVLWDNDARGNTDKSECHDYLNRDTLEWYEDSGEVIDTMMKVLADDSVAWGSLKQGIQYNHEDISKGKSILSAKTSLDASVEGGNCTPGLNATWADLEGGDVAIQFTGDVPIVAVCDGNWKGWTEIQAYDVDEKNGIAYYSAKTISAAWSGDTSEIEHLFARTNGVTTITNIAIIGGSEVIEQPTEEDKTVKYDLDLSKADRNGTLVLTFTSKAGGTANGCVGFMNGADWEMIQWEGKYGSDGVLTVEVPMSDIPESVKSAQAQVWWSDNEVSDFSYEVKSSAVTTETTATTKNEETTTATTTAEPASEQTDIVYGDANGDGEVNIADAVLILQSIANPDSYKIDDANKKSADVAGNGDGITTLDALAIQMLEAKVISSLPVAGELPNS